MTKLNIDFFERTPTNVAMELLGKHFICGEIDLLIVETEAYGDSSDLASHARFGKTQRSKIMFGEAGTLYIYLIYGMYYLTNVITGKEGQPGAVLLRRAKIISGKDKIAQNLDGHKKIIFNGQERLNGPGIISAALDLSGIQNGISLVNNDNIYIAKEDMKNSNYKIKVGKRIGIDYAGDSRDLLWRYTLDV